MYRSDDFLALAKNNKTKSRKGKGPSRIKDGVIFAGRDWYGTLASATTDTVASLGIINPQRNSTLFERLSKVSVDFAMFRFRKLVFHIVGMSPSTSKGSLAFTAFVNDGLGGGAAISNEASVKNTGNALIMRGDKSGKYSVRCNSMWLALDTNIGANTVGNSLGTLYHFIDGTPGAGDLSFDVWIDYVCEFRDPIRPGTTD